jgi:hypothetical protein
MLEAGAKLHEVQMTLGHENITTTSTYLNATPEGQREAFDKLATMRSRKRLRVAMTPGLGPTNGPTTTQTVDPVVAVSH